MSTGKQRSIWATDEEWELVRKSAELRGESISRYLLGFHGRRPFMTITKQFGVDEESQKEFAGDDIFRPHTDVQQIGVPKV